MPEFTLLGTNYAAREPAVSAERRLNVYYDSMRDEPEKGPIACYAVPGAQYHSNPAGLPPRGVLYVPGESILFAMFGNSLWGMSTSGTWTLYGSTSESSSIGSAQVTLVDQGFSLVVLASTLMYVLNYSTWAWSSMTSTVTPLGITPNRVAAYLGGYVLAGTNADSCKYYWTNAGGMPDVAGSWDALNVNSAYKKGDPINNITAYKDCAILFGSHSIEFHGLTGDSNSAFGPIAGSVVEVGNAYRFNPRVVGDSVIFLGRPMDGSLRYYKITGYSVEDITPPGLVYRLSNLKANATTGSTGTFSLGQNNFYYHRVAGTDENGFTVMYSLQTGLWYDLEGVVPDTTFPFAYMGTVPSSTVTGYAKPTTFAFGDEGEVYIFDEDIARWDGKHYRKQIVSGHLTDKFKGNTLKVNRVRVEAASGLLGDPQTFILEVSRDGGRTWGRELWCDTGAKGEYNKTLEWRRLGVAKDFVFRLTMPEGKIAVTRAWAEYEVLGR